ncbi:ABC transporter ATP-binding protein [Chelatococcus reniformis]|uniref:ABC transporter ATP-binding protein n=1 Tax=Chelatococcus reniformis TaxID=1494448 RepID=A0A916XDE7_9HYPH|nr:ABC transporter ATP-binding protein [Chelatococcus reniformis]GGC65418.1 ABC transporter ATP-binding protein [Chelatococcus reniformis]
MRLELDSVGLRYGPVTALSDVTLTVATGTTAAVIGANGAGKSSLLRAIAGLEPLAAGRIVADGADLARLDTEARIRLGIALSPEGRRLFPEMSAADNLRAGAFTRRAGPAVRRDLDRVYTLFPRLAERRASLARNLSGGEQQMCAIGRAVMSEPQLLLLDEPSLGLAPKVVGDMARAIATIAASGVTVLLAEQNSRLALSLAQTGHVFEAGRLARSGPAAALLNDGDVLRAYLGEEVASPPAGPIPAVPLPL